MLKPGEGVVARARVALRLPALAALIGVAALLLSAEGAVPQASSPSHAAEPFLQEQPVVVVSDRLVCSLLGEQGEAAGIRGMDNGGVVASDGVVYWTFGDTVLADGSVLPNSVGWSESTDASRCLDLTPKEGNSGATALMAQVPGREMTVWPMGLVSATEDRIHFYYASVVSDPDAGWRVTGVGIGSFDTETLVAERALGGALLWKEGMPTPSRAFTDGRYVYTLLDISRAPWTKDTILARVPKASIESPASYEYWDAGEADAPGRWRGDLWDEETGSWDSAVAELPALWRQSGMHNGVEVVYNDYLERWLAVYTTGFMSSVNVRSAVDLTGPWDGPEAVLVGCATFHPPAKDGFLCYSGAQHEFYTQDDGRTIYVSYSNSGTYQPYLHEIRLAAAITQWSDEQGHAIYLAGDVAGPDGFSKDGPAFYASDIRAPGLTPIHRWEHLETAAIRYGAAPPDPAGAYGYAGVAFYAPADAAAARAANALYAPVFLWQRADTVRYSPLNLAPAGFTQQEVAFYAACPDVDNDTLTDCEESFLGTNALLADTDGDRLPDGYELTTLGCHPLLYNDDRDGVPSPVELVIGTNPCVREAYAQTDAE
ncbi:MAG: DUF4185 domain-containing protein [Chloroflexi bacterium]|nr:DUF4185 domain-containing protein [Chloroflexota bacterium]